MTTVAVVLAAGRGRRFGGDLSKQFTSLAGQPIVRHAVQRFVDHPMVDQVWVVGAADELDQLAELTGDAAARYLAGGAERTDSVEAAVSELGADVDRVLIHDAARPWVPADVVTRVIEALGQADAVATVVPVADTIVEVRDGQIVRTPDRAGLVALQTPQGFAVPALASALQSRGDQVFTDDVSMVAALVDGARVTTVVGHPALHKVTTAADSVALEAWIERGLI